MKAKKSTRICKLSNIKWDIYDDEIPEEELKALENDLPKEYQFECDNNEIEETAIDFVSDTFGWCIISCDINFSNV